MIKPAILLSPRKSAIPAHGGVLEVLVRMQALDKSPESQGKKNPKRLSLVVDRSGSMDGQPLAEALNCVLHITNCITPANQMSVVEYDDKVKVLVPLSHLTSAEAIRQVVAQVESGGSTDLFAGWQAGAKQLEVGVAESISRMLLSDGPANHELCDVTAIEQHCRDWLARGVSTTTTVGLGRGFNEDLMIAMARCGGGQQYFGQTASDLFDSFDEEFSLLQALCLHQLNVKLIPSTGVIVETVGLVQKNADDSCGLSDMEWGAESWLMLRLHFSPSAAGDTRDLLAASLQAHTWGGRSSHCRPACCACRSWQRLTSWSCPRTTLFSAAYRTLSSRSQVRRWVRWYSKATCRPLGPCWLSWKSDLRSIPGCAANSPSCRNAQKRTRK